MFTAKVVYYASEIQVAYLGHVANAAILRLAQTRGILGLRLGHLSGQVGHWSCHAMANIIQN